ALHVEHFPVVFPKGMWHLPVGNQNVESSRSGKSQGSSPALQGSFMKSLRRFLTRLFNLAAKRQQEERLREEVAEHIELQTAENLRAGMPPVEARRQAMLKFGGVEAMKEDYRAERGLPLLENLLRDVRFGLRMLRNSPGFTAVAIMTLATAIGANAVVFSALNACMLRPLNVPEPESLYGLQFSDGSRGAQSYPNYVDMRDRNRSFEGLAI